MSIKYIGKGIATAGMWLGVALSCFSPGGSVNGIWFIFAFFGTIFVWND